MISRRAFIGGLAAGIVAAPLTAEAQQAGKVWRIGYLTPSSRPTRGVLEGLRQELRALGYVEGRNIVFEIRSAEDDFDRLPQLAEGLARINVDVIVAVSAPAIRAADNATTTIPIVMAFSGTDPVESTFVESLARPGGNITGVTIQSPALAVKRLEVLKECVPRLRRVAVLANLRNPASSARVKETQAAAGPQGLEVQVLDARLPAQYPAAFAAMTKKRASAVIVLADPVLSSNREQLVALAWKHGIPAMYEWREIVEAGGLMAYGPSLLELSRRVGVYVDKILKGAKPADLPVERPTKFEFVINLKTAKALGLTIPPSLLQRADAVIQ